VTARLLLDEMYPPALAVTLRDGGLDAVAVAACADLAGSDDAMVLDAANAQRRCLVTENVRDFAVLVRHASHHGVLLVHARRWPRTGPGLRKIADALHDAARRGALPVANQVRWLQ